jgi:hypothetical protein
MLTILGEKCVAAQALPCRVTIGSRSFRLCRVIPKSRATHGLPKSVLNSKLAFAGMCCVNLVFSARITRDDVG